MFLLANTDLVKIINDRGRGDANKSVSVNVGIGEGILKSDSDPNLPFPISGSCSHTQVT